MKKLIAMILTGVLSVSSIGTAGVFAEESIPYDIIGEDYSEIGVEDYTAEDISADDYSEEYVEQYSDEDIVEVVDETMVSEEEYIEETDELAFEEISIESDDTENSGGSGFEASEQPETDLIDCSDKGVDPQPSSVEDFETEAEESLVGESYSFSDDNAAIKEGAVCRVGEAGTGGTYYKDIAAALVDENTLNKTVTMIQNVETNNTLYIYQSLVLDLNGKTITGNLDQAVINVYDDAVFTIQDSAVNSGKICHSNNGTVILKSGVGVDVINGTLILNGGNISWNNESGVRVWKDSKFIMNGGAVSHNTNERGSGGGISVWTDSKFIMNGGDISNNTAKSHGGGIFNEGNTIIRCGTIKNNICVDSYNYYGGGVFSRGELIFEPNGPISINENTRRYGEDIVLDSNVYLDDNKKIIISGNTGFSSGTSIGISRYQNATGIFTSGYKNTESPNIFFTSDEASYYVDKDTFGEVCLSLDPNAISGELLHLGDNTVTFPYDMDQKTVTLVFDTNANADRLCYVISSSDADMSISEEDGSRFSSGSYRSVGVPGSVHHVNLCVHSIDSYEPKSVTITVTRMPDIDHIEAIGDLELIAGPDIVYQMTQQELWIKVCYKDGSTEEAKLHDFADDNDGEYDLYLDEACTQYINEDELKEHIGEYAYKRISINKSNDWRFVVKYKIKPYNPDDYPLINADNVKHEVQRGKMTGFRLKVDTDGYYDFVGFNVGLIIGLDDFEYDSIREYKQGNVELTHVYLKANKEYFIFIYFMENEGLDAPEKGSFCFHKQPVVVGAKFELTENKALTQFNEEDVIKKVITYTDPETNAEKTFTAGLDEFAHDGDYYFNSSWDEEFVGGTGNQVKVTLAPEEEELSPNEKNLHTEALFTSIGYDELLDIEEGTCFDAFGENCSLLDQVIPGVLDENDHNFVLSEGTREKIKELMGKDPSSRFYARLVIRKEQDAQKIAEMQNALPPGSTIKYINDIKIELIGNGNVLGNIEEIDQDLILRVLFYGSDPNKQYSIVALHNGSIINLDVFEGGVSKYDADNYYAMLWVKAHCFSSFAVVENPGYKINVTQPSTVGSFTVKVNDGEETDQSTTAKAGDNITLSAAMNSGYYFSSFTVKDLDDNLIPVSDGSSSNVKKFTMPEKSVSVTAAFSESAPYVDPTPVHTHSYVDTVTKEATCGQDGVITHTCSCGNSYTSTIPATGNHSYGTMGIITTPATCTAEGAMTYTCSVCGNTKTETVKATGHEWNTSYTVITAPTETVAGSKAIFCSVCGAMQPGSEAAIPATGKPSGIKTEEEKVDSAATVIQSGTSTKAEVNTAIENLITDLDSKDNEEIIKGGSQSIDTTKDGEETSYSLDLSALETLTDKIDATLSGAEYKDVKIGSTESAEAVIGEEKIEASLSGGTAIAAAAIKDAEESALDSTASVRTVVKLENAALKDNVLSFDLKADVVDDKNNVIRSVGTAEYHELPSPVTVTITLPASMSELVNLVVKHDGVIVPYQAVYKNGKIAALKIALGSLSPFTIIGESPADAAAKVAEELSAAAKGMTESSTAEELRAAIKAIDDIDDQTMRYLDNSQRTALEEARAHAAAILTSKTAAAEEKAKAVIDAGKDLTTKEKVDAAEAACVALTDADKAFLTEAQLADVTSAEEKIHHAKAVQMAKDVIEAGKDLSTPEKVREAKAALDLLGSTGYARFLDAAQDAELIAAMNAASQAITAVYEAQGVADLVQAVIDAAGKDLEDKANLDAAAKAGLAAQDLTEELLAKLDMTKRAEYEAAKAKITAYCAVDQAGEKLKLEGETLTEENIKAAEKDVTDAADAIAAAKALGVDTPKLEEALTKLKADLEGVKEACKKKLATEAETAVAAAEKAAKEDLTKADKLDAARKAAEAAQTAVDKAKAGGADVGALTTRLSAAKDAIRKAEGGSEVPSQVQAYLKAAARVPASDKIKEKQRKRITAANKLYRKLTKEQKARADVKAANKKVKASLKALNKPVIKFNKMVQKTLNKKGTKTRWIKVKAGKTLKLKAKSSTGARITYKSSKKKVATVSKKGVIKAKKKGKAVITVKCNKKTVKVRIRVK